jgi:hypothetical protein
MLRSVSVSTTLAPGTALPLASVTAPRTDAVYDDCAQTGVVKAGSRQTRHAALSFPMLDLLFNTV